MSFNCPVHNFVLVKLALETEYLATCFAQDFLFSFGGHTYVAGKLTVHLTICYTHYTSEVGVILCGAHLGHAHSAL